MMAMQRTLQHLHDNGSIAGVEDQLMMFRERQQMVDAEHFNTLAQRYATRMV
jgi:hypothetical protein